MTSRVVFDCMVFLQGAGRRLGPAGACLQLVDDGKVLLCVSTVILTEVRDVLTRPETLERFPGLSAEWVDSFVNGLESKGLAFRDIAPVVKVPRDPRDEPYANLAVAAGAAYLVTRDHDLLDLMHDEGFRQQYPELRILEPVEFLREMAARSK